MFFLFAPIPLINRHSQAGELRYIIPGECHIVLIEHFQGAHYIIFCEAVYILSFRRKKREPEKKARNPPGQYRCARPSAARGFTAGKICSLFFPEKEKRTRKESREPAWAVPLRPPVSGARISRKIYFAGLFKEKPRREKWVTDDGGGLPDGLRPPPPR